MLERVLSLGQRSALSRMAHLFCELPAEKLAPLGNVYVNDAFGAA